jgi:single-stranded-DNA-specific exonuclease
MNVLRRVPDAASAKVLVDAGIDPVLANLFSARGVRSAAELDTRLAVLPAPLTMKGMQAAVERIAQAIAKQERVCIVADYDADGATACAVGLRGLRAFGARVDYLVPNRFEFGYGLTPEIVALANREKSPKLIITVDNGIASVEGVAAAAEMGIDVVVTDHHLPGPQLPAALIVNPNQPGCTFESKALAGVGVMFYVLMALRAHLDARHVNLAQWLDLVATGTVADVVPLDHLNRALVDQGLRRIRSGQCCAGLLALYQVAGKDPRAASSQDMGFILGPRINAAGRLSDISLGIECLITDDVQRAQEIAFELDALNRERRDIESGMRAEAMRVVDSVKDVKRFTVCLMDDSWHQGVIGIVAGRVKDATHRPTIIFAPGNTEDEIKGSGRSIPGFHMRDALDLVSKRHPTLIQKFGGHAMAAGLSLARADFKLFCDVFEEISASLLDEATLVHSHSTDGPYFAPTMSMTQIEALGKSVWGQNFPPPLFDEPLRVDDQRIVGSKHSKLRVTRQSETLTALLWNHIEPLPQHIRAVYRPTVNTFQGNRNVELIIDAWEPM